MRCAAKLLPALEIQLHLPPDEWARAVTAGHLDEPNKAYLREEYRRWRMHERAKARTPADPRGAPPRGSYALTASQLACLWGDA